MRKINSSTLLKTNTKILKLSRKCQFSHFFFFEFFKIKESNFKKVDFL